MLLIVEKGIREGACESIDMVKLRKYIKDYDKNKESSYIQYWGVNNLYGWDMLQKLPVNYFEWIKNTSQFNEHVIKSYTEKSDEGYFLEVDVQCI